MTAPAAADLPATPAAPAVADIPATPSVGSPADSTAAKLDQAVAAQAKGDKAAAADALKAGADAAETQAKASKGDFKDKLLSQVGNLRALLPLLTSGMLGGGTLGKTVGLAKMALGANQISSLLGGGSLLGSASALTGGLNLLKGGLPSLGGLASGSGSSLIDGALATVGQLNTLCAPAEPAARQSLGGVMNFAKGLF